MREIYYDDSELRKMFAELSEKERRKALRGAFRRAANKVRRVALENLHRSIAGDKELDRGVRTIVYRRKAAGFRVTVGTKRDRKRMSGQKKRTRKQENARGYYTSRKRRDKAGVTGKPVLIWAEDGTAQRYTKGSFFSRLTKKGLRNCRGKGRPTGAMKRYGFMARTRNQVHDSVTEDLKNEVINNVIRVARKHGCK